jgi:hypothetical protein|eukprot:COSAG06_NODE_14352_length_1164_cov_0.873239_1_plen_108_part_00
MSYYVAVRPHCLYLLYSRMHACVPVQDTAVADSEDDDEEEDDDELFGTKSSRGQKGRGKGKGRAKAKSSSAAAASTTKPTRARLTRAAKTLQPMLTHDDSDESDLGD